jgi:thioredoxin-like negative regulator of GroEL
MNKSLRPVWGIFAILCAVVAIATIAKALRPNEIIPWRTDFAAATEEARRDGKPVLAYFTATWCGPCRTLSHTTWADTRVDDALRAYVPVKIDIDRRRDLAEAYGIRAVPTFAVLGSNDRPLRQTDGALPPDDFLRWLGSGR